MKFIMMFFIIIGMIICCKEKNQIEFKLDEIADVINEKPRNLKDSIELYVLFADQYYFGKCDSLLPQFTTINVSSHLSSYGEYTYLSSIGFFIEPYENSPFELLAFTIFLRKKYGLSPKVYDQLLRSVIKQDDNNVIALFLLAELRYKYEYFEDAYFLLDRIIEIKGNSEYLDFLMDNIYDKMAGQIVGGNINDFLKENRYFDISTLKPSEINFKD